MGKSSVSSFCEMWKTPFLKASFGIQERGGKIGPWLFSYKLHAREERVFFFGGYGKSMCLMVEFSTSSNFMFQSVPGADNRV